MKNAVIYARYSSDKQTELSIDAQLTACYNFAKTKDLNIIQEYVDRAYTGRNDNRPEFRKMIKDSEKQIFEYILVYKLDRFARNRYDSAINKKILRNNGVRVLSAMEQLTDTPESILMESMIEGYAEYYSAELSQKIRNNQAELIKQKGRSLGGNPTYGFRVVDHFYQIEEEQADNVRIIFEEYAEKGDIPSIVEKMKILGIKTGVKNYYTSKTVERFLGNKRYIGIYEFAGQILEDYFPAIVDKRTFNLVQKRLQSRKKGKKNIMDYLLSGKLFCGYCQQPMYGDCGTSNNKTYYYYTCSSKRIKKSCHKGNISKDWIENYLVQTTINYVFQEDRINNILKEIEKIFLKTKKQNTEIVSLNKSKLNIEKQIKNVLEVIKNGQHNKSLYSELDNLENQLDIIDSNIAKAEYLEKNQLTFDKIKFMLLKLKKLDDKEKQKMLILNTFISYVVLWDDKIEIHYNLSKDSTQAVKFKKNNNNDDGGENSGIFSENSADGSPIYLFPNFLEFIIVLKL